MATGQSEITLRFLAAPTDVATLGGSIHGGRVLEWIDKAAYALRGRLERPLLRHRVCG